MKLKKMAALLLVFAMVSSAFACCGKLEEEKDSMVDSPSEDADGQGEDADGAFDPRSITEGVVLTVGVPSHERIIDYETNEQILRVEEELGVDLQFEVIAEYNDKVMVMAGAGDELPDMLWGCGEIAANLIEQGVVLPLNEYYDNPEYSANMRASEEKSSVNMRVLMSDGSGNMYGFPSAAFSFGGTVQNKGWIYEPWVEAIGGKMPTTTDEYFELMKEICASDPNGNGKKDEVAMVGSMLKFDYTYTSWFDWLMNPFIYSGDKEKRILENGEISVAYDKEEWREGLRYIKQFFDEGLISSKTLTNDVNGRNADLMGEELIAACFSWWYYNDGNLQRRIDYEYLPALVGPNGESVETYIPLTSVVANVITVDCENPKAAYLVMDHMMGEDYGIITRFGTEGELWDWWENAKLSEEERAKYAPDFEGYEPSIVVYDDSLWGLPDAQNLHLVQTGPFWRTAEVISGWMKVKEASTEEEKLQVACDAEHNTAIMAIMENIPEEYVESLPLTLEEMEVVNEIKETLEGYWSESTSKFLMGELDLDADWDDYLQELETIGLYEMLEIYQASYDRTYK